MEIIKIGIAGYGVVGQKRHTELLNIQGARVVAICDRRAHLFHTVDNEVSCYSDYRQLIEHDLDAVLICLTNDMVALVTAAALKRGLHVFCEKPPARTLAELNDVATAYGSATELVLMYGFNHRYHDSVEKAKELVDSGDFGEIVSMRGVYGKSKLITFNQTDWRTRSEVAGGGVLLDQGIHLVDLMVMFAGEFPQVHSFVSADFWGYDVEDNVFALMRNQSGVVASLVSSALQWQHRFELEITLTSGFIRLNGLLTGSKSYGEEKIQYAVVDHQENQGDLIETTIKFNTDSSWRKELQCFVKCIQDNQIPIAGSLEDAQKTLRQVYRIYAADREWAVRSLKADQ